MSTDADRFLNEDLERLRRQKGYCPLTPEEAEKELNAAPKHPLSASEIDSIVDHVTSGDLTDWETSPNPEWIDDVNTSGVEEDVLQLNRNLGEDDAETDTLVDELRKKALNNEDKPNGVDGESKPPGAGGSQG